MNAFTDLALGGFNHVLRGEDWAWERLRQHAGARISITLGIVKLPLMIDDQGLFRRVDHDSAPDVTLTLPADALLNVLLDREKAFSSVKLGGSADIAESLAFVLRNLRWDAEADLADLIGDIPARRLALFGRSVAAGVRSSLQKVGENIGEYFAEDAGMIAPQREITAFGNEVNRLRDDLARLEKRISAL